MATYYNHMENNEGGVNAAAQSFAEQRVNEIKAAIEELQGELKVWLHVINLVSAQVCQTCRGEKTITWYPTGTGPGQGTRTRVPCPGCRKHDYTTETNRINKRYQR